MDTNIPIWNWKRSKFIDGHTKKYFFIDFDSTLVQTEGLEELARVVLNRHPKKKEILEKIKKITKKGMEGKIPFNKSLDLRLKLIPIDRLAIQKTVSRLEKKISPSFLRNKKFFKTFNPYTYIISGGFKEFILPIAKKFGISESHILANDFIFDLNGKVTGIDTKNPLSQKGGKAKAVKNLNLEGDLYILGDGYTDYQIKKYLPEAKFIAFTETVFRENVAKKADYVFSTFDDFLFLLK